MRFSPQGVDARLSLVRPIILPFRSGALHRKANLRIENPPLRRMAVA